MKKYLVLFIVFMMTIMMTFAGCSDSSEVDVDNGGEEVSEGLDDLTELFSKSEDYLSDGISYTQTMTSGEMTSRVTTWMKDDLFKTSTSMEGQEVVSIINYETNETTVYYPQQKTGTVITMTDDDAENDSFDISDFQEQVDPMDFENLGTETINGEKCYVIESKDMVTSSSAKMWISQKYGIVMRMEAIDSTTGEGFVYEIEEMTIGIDDSEFEVPSDINLQSFSW